MTLSRPLTLALLLGLSLSLGAVRPVKPKTPVVPVEHLLQEAETAYRAYRFEAAREALTKYETAMQRRKEGLSEQARLLEEQLSRAERMYSRAEELVVTDSLLVPKKMLLEYLPQGSGSLESEDRSLPGDSLFPALSFRDALARNLLRSTPKGLAWLSSLGGVDDLKWEAQPMDFSALAGKNPATSPFLLEDGTTLLFARSSEQGLGGYDLYMTRLTEQGNSFFEPTLLGMPYNSPANDYLLTYYETEGWGVLVSDRFAPADSVHIYRFTGRPPFLSGNSSDEAKELSGEEAFRRASLQGVLKKGASSEKSSASSTPMRVALAQEFTFILQGDQVYHHLADFKTSQGMEAFRQSQLLQEKLTAEEATLAQLRRSWPQVSSSERESLRSQILLLEATVHKLRRDHQQALRTARYYEGVR